MDHNEMLEWLMNNDKPVRVTLPGGLVIYSRVQGDFDSLFIALGEARIYFSPWDIRGWTERKTDELESIVVHALE